MIKTQLASVNPILTQPLHTTAPLKASTMAHQSIHNFYRVWFTCVDPLTLLPTVYALIYTPEFMLEGLIPTNMAVYNPLEGFFYH